MHSFPSHKLPSLLPREKQASSVVGTTDHVSTVELYYCNRQNWKYVDRYWSKLILVAFSKFKAYIIGSSSRTRGGITYLVDGSAEERHMPGLIGHQTSPHWIFPYGVMWRTSSTRSKTTILSDCKPSVAAAIHDLLQNTWTEVECPVDILRAIGAAHSEI
jgi:hypothetical protein